MKWQELKAAFCRVKPITREIGGFKLHGQSLRKCLSTFDLICYGVGCSVGAGVYSLIGVGADVTGSSISLSFLISGVACIFTSLTYSEFAARVPVTGSAYTFVYVSFGELAAWLIGWNLTLGYGISSAGISRSWAVYVLSFFQNFGVHIPDVLVNMYWFGWPCCFMASFLICACTFILSFGVEESSKFNACITLLNIAVLLFVVIRGTTEVDPSNWQPFMPKGIAGVMQGAGIIFFSYLGFDMVSCLAEEVQDPQKMLPRGIIGSLLISMAIYVSVSVVVTGMAPVDILGSTVPLVNAFSYHHLVWAETIISFGSMFGLTTAAFTCLMGQPRIFYRMANDGLLPNCFATVNEKTQVPIGSTIVTGILVSILAFFFDLEFLAGVISCGTLQAFTFVNAGVVVLRVPDHSHPGRIGKLICSFIMACFACSFSAKLDLAIYVTITFLVVALGILLFICTLETTSIDTFRCPCVPVVPCIGIACNIYMMTSLTTAAWVGVGVWLLIGLLIYLSYGIHHSTLRSHHEFEPLVQRSSQLK